MTALNENDSYLARLAICDSSYLIEGAMTRPSVLYRPTLSADGTQWLVLLGENLQSGVAGFGETPEAAMTAFDEAFRKARTPDAMRMAAAPHTETGGSTDG